MQQSTPHRRNKWRRAKIKLEKMSPLQLPPPDHRLQWEQRFLPAQPTARHQTQEQLHTPSSSQHPSVRPSLSPTVRLRRRNLFPPPPAKLPWDERPVGLLLRALVFFGLIAFIGTATHGTLSFGSMPTSVTQETASGLTPSPQFQWITTQTFSGIGSQKTKAFSVGGHWHIMWRCDLVAVDGQGYLLLIQVDAPDGSMLDRGVETICQQTNRSGVDEMYGGEQVSLNVMSSGEWTVQVQKWQQAGSS